MRKLLLLTLIAVASGSAAAREIAHGGREGATEPTRSAAAPSTLTAPLLEGIVGRVDGADSKIVISGREMLINAGLVVRSDKRANSGVTLRAADLKQGTRVRYRADIVPGVALPRVVEIWLASDAGAPSGAKPRT